MHTKAREKTISPNKIFTPSSSEFQKFTSSWARAVAENAERQEPGRVNLVSTPSCAPCAIPALLHRHGTLHPPGAAPRPPERSRPRGTRQRSPRCCAAVCLQLRAPATHRARRTHRGAGPRLSPAPFPRRRPPVPGPRPLPTSARPPPAPGPPRPRPLGAPGSPPGD